MIPDYVTEFPPGYIHLDDTIVIKYCTCFYGIKRSRDILLFTDYQVLTEENSVIQLNLTVTNGKNFVEKIEQSTVSDQELFKRATPSLLPHV